MLVSDLIVIWRAWTLFPGHRWVILPPFVLWIGSVGEQTCFPRSRLLLLNICTLPGTMVGCLSLLLNPNLSLDKRLPGVGVFTTSLALSVATNGVTTMIIAYKLWYAALNGY